MDELEFVGGPDDGRMVHCSRQHEYIWTDGIPDHITIYLGTERVRPCYKLEGNKFRFIGYRKDKPCSQT